MKKILLILFMALPLMALQAREKRDDSKYLAAGVVPTDANGMVAWHQAFAVPGKGAAEVYATMKAYMERIEQQAIHDLRTNFMEQEQTTGSIVLRCEEWMLFRKAPMYLDRTRFRYHYQVKCQDGRCDMTITQITYYYEEEMDGTNGKTYKAEEWITDKEAVNKKRTKLQPYSGKFRRKTVDRVEEIFEGARQAFETPEPQEVKEQKRATKLLND